MSIVWPNGWMDEDVTWYGSKPRPRPQCIRRGPSSLANGAQQPPLFGPCLLWPRWPISATAELVLKIGLCARCFINERTLYWYAVARTSVVCLSVTFVHPTQPVEIFGNFSTPWPSLDIHEKLYVDRPWGTPPSGRRKRGSQIQRSFTYRRLYMYLGNGARYEVS